jgi:Ulp1 family protease
MRNHEKSYEQVLNWHRLFDFFAQKIVVVPINSVCHWTLAVIVGPDSLLSGGSEHVCTIYHLDSLKRFPLHDTRDIGFRLKQYMLSVWLDDRNNHRKNSISESQMRVAIFNIPVFAVEYYIIVPKRLCRAKIPYL